MGQDSQLYGAAGLSSTVARIKNYDASVYDELSWPRFKLEAAPGPAQARVEAGSEILAMKRISQRFETDL